MKKLILMLPLTVALFTACGGALLPQPSAVKGKVSGYTGGAATINLKADSNIAAGSVNASGEFTLALPSGATLAPYLSSTSEGDLFPIEGATCTGSFTNSNTASKTFGFESLYIGTTRYSTIQITTDEANLSASGTAYLFLYTDQATTLGGTKTCKMTDDAGFAVTTTVTYTAPLKVGWNLVREDVTSKGSPDPAQKAISTTVTFKTVADQSTTWYAQTGAQPLSLNGGSATTRAVEGAFR